MRDGVMVFNISKSMDIGVEMPNNFSYKRIDSAKKIHSYYKEMFDTGYALDYLAAQAFLRLTPQQQAAVAVQAEHTAGGNRVHEYRVQKTDGGRDFGYEAGGYGRSVGKQNICPQRIVLSGKGRNGN